MLRNPEAVEKHTKVAVELFRECVFVYGVCSLWIFRLESSGSRSQTLSLGEGGRRIRRSAALALALSAAG